jgi:hypothetical protein
MAVFTSPAGGHGAALEHGMTRAPMTLAAQRAASRRLHSGTSLQRPMRIMKVPAVLSYTVDPAEHARRGRAGGGAVLSPDVLNLLLGLPMGVPVPVVALTSRERGALRTAPRWAVRIVDRHAVRLAVTPVSVNLAVVAARSWRAGLDMAGRFAPFCARAIALDSAPPDDREMRMEADFYGVGVTVVRDERVEVLVAPSPFQPPRPTAAGWRFTERVYEQHLHQQISATAAASGAQPEA